MSSLNFLDDELFIRDKTPLTKKEIRILSFSMLKLNDSDTLLDIGGGSGGIAIDAARFLNRGKVYTVEENEKRCEIIEKNREKFDIKNLEIICGKAPFGCKNIKFNKLFVGGSGAFLSAILDWGYENIDAGGRMVLNAITLESAFYAINFFEKKKILKEFLHIQISKGIKAGEKHMMKSENGVWIIGGEK